MKRINLFLLLALPFLLSSCATRPIGTWYVESFEIVNTGLSQNSTKVRDIGTFTFRRNGRGEKNISYSLMGMPAKVDNMAFTWTANRRFVTMEGGGSEFSRSWIRIRNRWRYQKWKTTDGGNQVKVLELSKRKPKSDSNNNVSGGSRGTLNR